MTKFYVVVAYRNHVIWLDHSQQNFMFYNSIFLKQAM